MMNYSYNESWLDDPDYERAVCGLIVHVWDLDDHDGTTNSECPLCEQLERNGRL